MNLPEIFPSPRNVNAQLMKPALILVLLSCALLIGGCADQSLMTDEEYAASRGPAPHSPDYSGVLPRTSSTLNPGY